MTLSEYSTEELERLTTLTFQTMKGGEYVDVGAIVLRGHNGSLVTADGHIGGLGRFLNMATANRRVVSFTDATELDPPQAEMLAELARRKAPPLRFKKGDVVVRTSTPNHGHIATLCADVKHGDVNVEVELDDRIKAESCGIWGTCCFRLATPADKAAYEARIPKPPTFQVGELVAFVDTGNLVLGEVIPKTAPQTEPVWKDFVRVQYVHGGEGVGLCRTSAVRPATDAEIAAYHRAHCQPKVAPPTPISNATHAGQWVKWNYGPCLVMAAGAQGDEKVEIVSLKGGRFYVRPDYLTLIDPPTWPK